MKHCLSRKHFELFSKSYIHGAGIDDIEDDDLKLLVSQGFNWESSVSLLSYFFAHYIQKNINSGTVILESEVDAFFDLAESGSFEIHLIDRDFTAYFLNHDRYKIGESLEDALVILLQNYIDHRHDSSLCF